MKITKITASKKAVKPVKAATSLDMLEAFENRLAELGVESKTDITCGTDDTYIKCNRDDVEITTDDYGIFYDDTDGGFGEAGSTYSFAEIKQYWNDEKDNDPVLVEYPDFDSWWKDTRRWMSRHDDDLDNDLDDLFY